MKLYSNDNMQLSHHPPVSPDTVSCSDNMPGGHQGAPTQDAHLHNTILGTYVAREIVTLAASLFCLPPPSTSLLLLLTLSSRITFQGACKRGNRVVVVCGVRCVLSGVWYYSKD